MDWKTIESAPKDGRILLGCDGHGSDFLFYRMCWHTDILCWGDPEYDGTYMPTHWAPAPDEPRTVPVAQCDHAGWTFDKHGRCCPKCGVFMVDWGD